MTFSDLTSGAGIVFAHRGASAYAPPNTLPAFELAATQGAAGIELDVHLSSDGHPVIIHDFTIDETASGHGVIKELTLEQLKEFDPGGWFDPKFAGVRIPTLHEVFAAVGQKLLVNVEIKADTARIEHVVAESLERFGMKDRVIISSFNPEILRRFRAVMPEVAIGYLYMPGRDYEPEVALKDFPFEALHPYHEMITADYVTKAKQENHHINTWTVNDPERAVELKRLGVNVIITDNPDVLLAALK